MNKLYKYSPVEMKVKNKNEINLYYATRQARQVRQDFELVFTHRKLVVTTRLACLACLVNCKINLYLSKKFLNDDSNILLTSSKHLKRFGNLGNKLIKVRCL